MRIHGWCLQCHRFRRVDGTIPTAYGGRVVMGYCDECIEANVAERDARRAAALERAKARHPHHRQSPD